MPTSDEPLEPGTAGAATPLFRRWYMLAILAILPLLLYSPALGFSLLGLDDTEYFRLNSALHQGGLAGLRDLWTGPYFHDYSPITQLTIWLDLFLSHGSSLIVSRVQQLLWLALGSLAIFQIVRRLSGRDGLAWAVALLYCLHPVVTESALWLGERKNLVAFALSCWAIERHIAWRQGAGRGAFWASLVLCPLALLAKPHAVIIPAVIAAYELVLGAGSWRSRLLVLLPSGLATATYIALSVLLLKLYHSRDDSLLGGSLPAAVLCDGAILARYLGHAILPHRLSLYYRVIEDPGQWPGLLAWWLLVIGVVAGSIAIARERRVVLFCWLAAGCSLLPVINLKPLPLAMSDHYLHWALPWLLFILGQLAVDRLSSVRPSGWERPAGAIAAGYALFLLLGSVTRTPEFSSGGTAAMASIRNQPDCALGWAGYCGWLASPPQLDFDAAGRAGMIALRCQDAHRIFLRPYVTTVVLATLACQHHEGTAAADKLLAQALPRLSHQYRECVQGMVLLLENRSPEAVAVLAPLYSPVMRQGARALRLRCRGGELQPWDIPPGAKFDEDEDELNLETKLSFKFEALGALANAYLQSGDPESAFDLSALLLNLMPRYLTAAHTYRDACHQLGLEHAVQRAERELLAGR